MSAVVTDSLFFLLGSILTEYLRAIQENVRLSILKCDRNRFIEQIELHKKVIDCFKLLEDVFFCLLICKLVFCGLGICILGFEITVVSRRSHLWNFQMLRPAKISILEPPSHLDSEFAWFFINNAGPHPPQPFCSF